VKLYSVLRADSMVMYYHRTHDFYDDWYNDFDGFDDAEMYWDDYH